MFSIDRVAESTQLGTSYPKLSLQKIYDGMDQNCFTINDNCMHLYNLITVVCFKLSIYNNKCKKFLFTCSSYR